MINLLHGIVCFSLCPIDKSTLSGLIRSCFCLWGASPSPPLLALGVPWMGFAFFPDDREKAKLEAVGPEEAHSASTDFSHDTLRKGQWEGSLKAFCLLRWPPSSPTRVGVRLASKGDSRPPAWRCRRAALQRQLGADGAHGEYGQQPCLAPLGSSPGQLVNMAFGTVLSALVWLPLPGLFLIPFCICSCHPLEISPKSARVTTALPPPFSIIS